MKHLTIYLFIILVLLLNSCSSSRRAAKSAAPSVSASVLAGEYLNRYSALAVSEMKRTGIPASIKLAQGMLESDYGRSTLAVNGNNHFGIKCHSDWNGPRIYHDDNRKGECFRAYPSAEDSYRDHSDFLVKGSRYRDLFSLSSTDYKGWAHGLKKAGYATDPNYAHLLIRKIEEFGLDDYDKGRKMPGVPPQQTTGTARPGSEPKATASVPATSPRTVPASASTTAPVISKRDSAATVVQRAASTTDNVREEEAPIKVISLGSGRKIMTNNNVEYILVETGDTYESLAVKYQLLAWELTRYNDLAPGTPLQPGQVLYLQPKRTKAAQGNLVHNVEQGETMYSISQKYAVRLSSLYKMNLMTEGSECKPGQKLRLR